MAVSSHHHDGYSFLMDHALPFKHAQQPGDQTSADTSDFTMHWSTAMLLVAFAALGCLRLLECCFTGSNSAGNSATALNLSDFNSPRPGPVSASRQGLCQSMALYCGGMCRYCTLLLRWLRFSYAGDHKNHSSAAKFRKAMRDAKPSMMAGRMGTDATTAGASGLSGGITVDSDSKSHDIATITATSTSASSFVSGRYPVGSSNRKKAAHVV